MIKKTKEVPQIMLSRVFETTKTVIIFILCVTMLVMMLLLMIAEQDDGGAAYPFEERMIFYENGAEVADGLGMDTSRIRPTAIAFRSPKWLENDGGTDTSEATLRVVSDGDIAGRVYASLYPLLQDLLGHFSRGTEISDGARVWKEALTSSELIYITYPDDLPTALIFAYTFDDGESEESRTLPASSAYGCQLLFCAGENEELIALVRASDGTVIRFAIEDNGEDFISDVPTDRNEPNTLSEDDLLFTEDTSAVVARISEGPLHASTLSAYIETVGNLARDAYFACFLSELPSNDEKTPEEVGTQDVSQNDDRNDLLFDDTSFSESIKDEKGVFRLGGSEQGADTTLVYQSTRAVRTAEVFSFAGMRVLDASESEGLYTLLHMAAMRDSAVENHYTDRDGGRVYMDAHGRLYISADGEIDYHALQNGGISGSTFLGYSNVSGVYTLREAMQIADRLVSAFTKEIAPMLCGVKAQNDGTVSDSVLKTPILSVTAQELEDGVSGVKIRYGYSIDGLLLRDEEGEIITSYTVTVSGDAVYAFSMMPLYGAPMEGLGYLLPVQVALDAMTLENERLQDCVGIMEAAYILRRKPDTKEVLMPEWLFSET